MNGYGKLRRMTGRNPAIVVFCLYLAAAFVTIRQLIQHARTPLPLGHPPHHQTTQVTPIAGALLVPLPPHCHGSLAGVKHRALVASLASTFSTRSPLASTRSASGRPIPFAPDHRSTLR